jgi:hypothetical protein
MKAQWYVCEAPAFRSNGGFCLYTERAAAKMEERLGLCRCIKHGALLGYDDRLDGKSRTEARRFLKADGVAS